jgi:hypothetical protein
VQVAPSQSYSESLLRRIEDVFLQMDHDQGSEIVRFDDQTGPSSSVTYLEKVSIFLNTIFYFVLSNILGCGERAIAHRQMPPSSVIRPKVSVDFWHH